MQFVCSEILGGSDELVNSEGFGREDNGSVLC